MSIQFVAGKLKGEERKAIIQEVQKHMQEAALRAIKPLLTEFCEEELTVKLGRGKREPRRVGGQAREMEWQCGKCGCRDANQFTRDGHYQRALETGWGHIEGLRVPMLECQCWSVNAVGMMWCVTTPSWRSSGAFGWIWISRCSLARACARVCAS